MKVGDFEIVVLNNRERLDFEQIVSNYESQVNAAYDQFHINLGGRRITGSSVVNHCDKYSISDYVLNSDGEKINQELNKLSSRQDTINYLQSNFPHHYNLDLTQSNLVTEQARLFERIAQNSKKEGNDNGFNIFKRKYLENYQTADELLNRSQLKLIEYLSQDPNYGFMVSIIETEIRISMAENYGRQANFLMGPRNNLKYLMSDDYERMNGFASEARSLFEDVFNDCTFADNSIVSKALCLYVDVLTCTLTTEDYQKAKDYLTHAHRIHGNTLEILAVRRKLQRFKDDNLMALGSNS